MIGVLVLFSSWKLLRDSVNTLLKCSPPGMGAQEVGKKMVGVEGAEEIHDLHVWEITSGFPALAAHVLVEREEDCQERCREVEKVLYRAFGREHTTLQVDRTAEGQRLKFLPEIKKRNAHPP